MEASPDYENFKNKLDELYNYVPGTTDNIRLRGLHRTAQAAFQQLQDSKTMITFCPKQD